jgi:membrane-associated phospholipid phosphatase
MPRLRKSEWVLTCFFAYVSVIAPFFRDRPKLRRQPALIFAATVGLWATLAKAERGPWRVPISKLRDWLGIPLTYVAFREMGLFAPAHYPMRFEPVWNRWDELALIQWNGRKAIESFGPAVPMFLEACYLMVYGMGAYCIAALYMLGKRRKVDRFLVVYLTGTLLAYAMFPYFPSLPPRFAFQRSLEPGLNSVVRGLNLAILDRATIQTGVFPSAHVSSVFSGAWGMFLVLGKRSKIARALVLYAISVSVATVYGRYHYLADVVSGFGVSLLGALVGRVSGGKLSGQLSLEEARQSAFRRR